LSFSIIKTNTFMKLFQQLMLAPVTLGLIAPAATAAELNLEGVNQYASQEQVTSISQFSDVRPTDWAYQALNNLVERYGCVAGYPDSTYRGGRAMTRFEAAALLNACLDRVTEVTDELQRLMDEFRSELTVLKGRVDGLDAKVGELEATQFSTTTKLKGEATFVLGGVPSLETNDGGNVGNTALNYDVRLNFDTSFTGQDLLRTRLRSSNFNTDPFASSSSLFKLDKADNTTTNNNNTVVIDRLYYQFPVGNNVTLTAGPLVRNTEMSWVPTAYRSEILDFFAVAGAPGVYNKATGAGVGAQYVGKNGFIAGLNYVAQNGDDSDTGVFDSDGALNFIAQVGYKASNWGVGVGYRYGSEGTRPRTYNGLLGASGALVDGQESSSVAINAYWQPTQSGWVPSISAGYGYNGVSGATGATDATNSDSWFVGLQWDDAFAAGNTAGIAVGQAPTAETDGVNDATILEFFYKFQVTDNISITPALFYVDNNQRYQDSSKWGGVIQTKFTF
jgi:hypothetical protein